MTLLKQKRNAIALVTFGAAARRVSGAASFSNGNKSVSDKVAKRRDEVDPCDRLQPRNRVRSDKTLGETPGSPGTRNSDLSERGKGEGKTLN
jgi:hypothetical protein